MPGRKGKYAPKDSPEYAEYLSKNREYQRKWFSKNRDTQRERIKANKQKATQRNTELIWGYLVEHPCVDCGETDPVVLEFDHIGNDKEHSISEMVGRQSSESALRSEIAKCEVRCANCHRRMTALRAGNWWKSRFLS